MEEVHSAIYFNDARDHWWHDDFIELMVRRLELARHRRVLDVGCGFGHWARVWLPHFPPGVTLTGIDPEARSIAEAEKKNAAFLAERRLDVTTSYRVATAESLPYPDATFDLVMAQTVLIHVKDPGVAIAEMHRVLTPGGLLLLAEPNNLTGAISTLLDRPDFGDDVLLRVFDLELRIERGKSALGEGHNSAGEFLPRWLDAQRFSKVRGWINDRAYGIWPPYDTPQAKAEIRVFREFYDKGWHGRQPEIAKRYYLAGGGTEAGFDAGWAAGRTHDKWRLDAIDRGTYVSAGGSVFHLFAAWKR